MVWMSNYISSFYVDVTTYPCPNPDADTAIICPDEIGTFVTLIIQQGILKIIPHNS